MTRSLVIKKKICLIGSYGVGKTSMVRKFVYNKFEEKYLSTIGVNISKKIVNVSSHNNNLEIEFFIWDIANIEKFDSVVKNYLRGAHGAIIVTDITRPNTSRILNDYTSEFLDINPKAKIIGVGNKIDLANDLGFDKKENLESYKVHVNNFFFTSAKTGENINEVFNSLGEELVKDMKF